MRNFQITQGYFSRLFWRTVFDYSLAHGSLRRKVEKNFEQSEDLRELANYDTGSISLGECISLMCVSNYFKPHSVVEVGTYIGRSTYALSLGIKNAPDVPGRLFTCDASNNIKVEVAHDVQLYQHPGSMSYDMMAGIRDNVDMFFLDGSLVEADVSHIQRLSHPKTIFIIDDFEGTEKGIMNIIQLRKLLQKYFLVYPPQDDTLCRYGITRPNKLVVALPRVVLELKAQAE